MQIKQAPDEFQEPDWLENRADYARMTGRALVSALRIQTMVAIGLALGLMVLGPVAAYSSICGSLAVYLPGLLFTVWVGGKIGASSSTFLRAAALAEFGKLVFAGLLCALVFISIKPLAPVWFFAGMLAMLITSWIGLARAIR